MHPGSTLLLQLLLLLLQPIARQGLLHLRCALAGVALVADEKEAKSAEYPRQVPLCLERLAIQTASTASASAGDADFAVSTLLLWKKEGIHRSEHKDHQEDR